MSPANAAAAAPGPSRGDSARSIVDLNVLAVTDSFDGGEKRKPRRIRNEYVSPSADTFGAAAATSGTTRQPAGADASGWFISFAQVAYSSCHCHGLVAIAGSVSASASKVEMKCATFPPSPAVTSAAPGPTPTAIRPSPAAIARVSWPTANVFVAFVRGSMRVTVPAAPVVAQRAPLPYASAPPLPASFTLATGVEGLARPENFQTVGSKALSIQTKPPPAAVQQRSGRSFTEPLIWLVAGSTRQTIPSPPETSHAFPSARCTSLALGTRQWRSTRPVSGSIRKTREPPCAIQTDPFADRHPAGAALPGQLDRVYRPVPRIDSQQPRQVGVADPNGAQTKGEPAGVHANADSAHHLIVVRVDLLERAVDAHRPQEAIAEAQQRRPSRRDLSQQLAVGWIEERHRVRLRLREGGVAGVTQDQKDSGADGAQEQDGAQRAEEPWPANHAPCARPHGRRRRSERRIVREDRALELLQLLARF